MPNSSLVEASKVSPKRQDLQAILDREGIQVPDQDLRRMTFDQLQELFGAESSGRIIVAHAIKSAIWQAVVRIRLGTGEPVDGNLRTFFYKYVKPVVSKIPGALEAARDPYDTMLAAFVEMVADYRLFSYSELDLDDHGWEHRRLGDRHPEVVLVAEKVGFWRWLKRQHQTWSVSIVALGGAPSLLSSEYLLRDLCQRVDLTSTTLRVFSIVDWDPSGWQIEQAFARQLQQLGAPRFELASLMTPELFAPDDLLVFRYPLSRKQKTKTRKWIQATGGLRGEAFGLESDAADKARLTQQLRRHLEALALRPSSTPSDK